MKAAATALLSEAFTFNTAKLPKKRKQLVWLASLLLLAYFVVVAYVRGHHGYATTFRTDDKLVNNESASTDFNGNILE